MTEGDYQAYFDADDEEEESATVTLTELNVALDHAATMKRQFVRELAAYLAGRSAVAMSIKLQTGISRLEAEQWARLRDATPLFGYPSEAEAERLLADWLGID